MKDILISIRPKWVEKICHKIGEGNGKPIYEKEIEVRKDEPKQVQVPFKCYIYCTIARKNGQPLLVYKDGTVCFGDYRNACNCNANGEVDCYIGEGKVIGEFTCNRIDEYILTLDNGDNYATKDFMFPPFKEACLTQDEIVEYGKGKFLYGWHISNLKIYDQPKDLKELVTVCNKHYGDDCEGCDVVKGKDYVYIGKDCEDKGLKRLTRPPQSWCYVEGEK